MLRMLLLTALVLAGLLAVASVRRQRRLRAAADAQWQGLVHRMWEDL